MASAKTKNIINSLAQKAGITINGKEPWDVQVKSDQFYDRLLRSGTLGAGESYMEGEWECERIDELFYRLTSSDLGEYAKKNWPNIIHLLGAKLINRSRKAKAFEVGEKHYDTGNDLFRSMLDKRMIYSCGYWKNANNLDQAQEDKLDLICRKLKLKKGMSVLDIGGGWGGLAEYMAEKYEVSVVAVTISKEQIVLAREVCKGLPVEFRLQDYRELNQKFDRIVSVGMFEHVGPKNYRTYMQVVKRCLNDDGLTLLHTIMGNSSGGGTDPWIDKYIFPNGVIPSAKQIASAFDGLFVLEDMQNFGSDYDKTLMAWYKNFEAAWPELRKHYSETFYRMWRLYLLSCAGSFRARSIGLGQFVLSPKGVPGGYESVR